MAKLLRVVEGQGAEEKGMGWMMFCPACKCGHLFDHRWTFNGDQEKPTFRASMLSYPEGREGKGRCHSYVTDGQIQFLGDCTHPLAGQTVELPDWD